MTIGSNISEFAGKPVRDFDPGVGLTDVAGSAYALRVDWDASEAGTTMAGRIAELLADDNVAGLEALVIGAWNFNDSEGAKEVIQALVAGSASLHSLRALFLGDISFEEQEMSWIQQDDVTPLLTSFPGLETLRVRGSDGLRVGPIVHSRLRELAFETGGLPGAVIHRAVEADCPELRHLELWFGTDEYGYNGSLGLIAPLLSGDRFPHLEVLGLKNSEEQDEIAKLVANAPILERIDVLDLSMGTLSDAGAEALLASPHLGGLKRLDIRHHYVSAELVARLAEAVPTLLAGEPEEADEDDDGVYRYVEVSE